MRRADLPPLHVVTDDAIVARPGFLAAAAEIAEAGGSEVALHLRAPAASGLAVYRWAEALRRATHDAGAALLVNDRVDVARAVGADGVQLGGRGLEVRDARAVLGSGFLIGASVHAPGERTDADFLLAGNVYETASHPGRSGLGAAALRAFGDRPVIAIGGVTAGRVTELKGAGVQGIAAIRAVWDAPGPAQAVRSFLQEWQG